MAEGGMIEGLLGDDVEDAVAGEVAADAGSLDPAAAAAAMKAAETDPMLAAEAAAYFRKQSSLVEEQTRLVRIQTEHLHEQREVTLSRLKWRRSSDRIKAGIQGLLVLVAAAIAGLFAVIGTVLWLWVGQDLTYSPGWIHPMFYYDAFAWTAAIVLAATGTAFRRGAPEF